MACRKSIVLFIVLAGALSFFSCRTEVKPTDGGNNSGTGSEDVDPPIDFNESNLKDKYFYLTNATDKNGNNVLDNFSSTYKTFIRISSTTQKLNSGTVINAEDNPTWFKFFHKNASGNQGQGNNKYWNAFWGTSEINPRTRTITGDFYGQKVDVKFSDDCTTLTMTIPCQALYTENYFNKYPFGSSGEYTLTFTR